MKRFFLTSTFLLALLALTAGTAFAGSALELVQVRNDGGGPTFIFRVVGEFSDDELSGGFVQVEGGDDFPLYCSQTAPDTVICHTSKAVSGHEVVVGFGGARFWTHVKEEQNKSCYPVYDWLGLPDTVNLWVRFERACTDATTYVTNNPYIPALNYTYFFYENAPGAFSDTKNPGPGFYPY